MDNICHTIYFACLILAVKGMDENFLTTKIFLATVYEVHKVKLCPYLCLYVTCVYQG